MSQPTTILIVDDEPSGREMLAALLHAQGYQLAFAAGGADALAQAAKLQPDLILLDVMMPGIDGVEVIRRIRSEPDLRRVRIIALTGDVTRARLQNVFEAGADRFVAKPFRISELLDSVRTILRPPA